MPALVNIRELAVCPSSGGQSNIGRIAGAAMVWEGPRIQWVGAREDLPARHLEDAQDAGGACVIPGLVDCHTHLAFGGWRAAEFVSRIKGSTYLEIARAGGGIRSTVDSTRHASRGELLGRSLGFLREMASLGITTVECKSGYGLALDQELQQLEVYQDASTAQPLRIVPTLLAHMVPPEFSNRRQSYIDEIKNEWIPRVVERGLARFFDIFLEQSAFSSDESLELLKYAAGAGLGLKIHADQITDGGGASLAAAVGASSADHLECVSAQGIEDMARAGTVAVSLPLATLYLGQEWMPARRLIEAGVPVAVATDFNPGSAPSFHLPLALTLACVGQRMTPAEALKGATIYAARALDLETEIGSLEEGKAADFCLLNADSIEHWLYHFQPNAVLRTCVGGEFLGATEPARRKG